MHANEIVLAAEGASTFEEHLAALNRPDLFRKAAELRRAIQDCAEDSWKCL